MTREEIREILGVNEETMKKIVKRKSIVNRLNDKGLELIQEIKQGRNTIYEVNPIGLDYWDLVQNHYNVHKKEEHTLYTHARLEGGMRKSRASIIRDNEIGISGNTARRYDEMMLEDEILEIDSITIKKYSTIKNNNIFNVVYRYLDKDDNIIYIGKTNNLSTRTYAHSIEDKLDNWFYDIAVKLEYTKLNTYDDCTLVEMYLISKLKPKYNIEFMDLDITLDIPFANCLTWKEVEVIGGQSKEVMYKKGKNYDKILKSIKKHIK